MRALLQKHNGYSGRSEGPAIADANEWLEFANIEIPSLKDGQVLIKLQMASVNPSDLHFIKGEYGQPRIQGIPAGFEGVGNITEGEGAYAQSLIGQRVAFVVAFGCSGAWADYAVADAAACIPVRPELKASDAAGLIVNPLTAMAMVDLAAERGADSFFMTAGNSQLCKLMIALAKDRGMKPIPLIRKESQVAHLKELGAADVLDTSAPDFMEKLGAVTKSLKPRVLLDAISNQLSADVFNQMPNRSHWVVYGKLDPTPPTIPEMGQFVFTGKVIEGFWLTNWFRSTSLEQQIKTITEVQERFITGKWENEVSGTLQLDEMIEKLPDALKSGAKVMIVPGDA